MYAVIRWLCRKEMSMKTHVGNEEMRWQVVKAMIDEFPTLKNRVKTYLEDQGD